MAAGPARAGIIPNDLSLPFRIPEILSLVEFAFRNKISIHRNSIKEGLSEAVDVLSLSIHPAVLKTVTPFAVVQRLRQDQRRLKRVHRALRHHRAHNRAGPSDVDIPKKLVSPSLLYDARGEIASDHSAIVELNIGITLAEGGNSVSE